jgi:hypothetical protein
MARYQGNGNNNAHFGQQVLDASGLAFVDASIPATINLVGGCPYPGLWKPTGE